jgi:hypothetical protein
VAGGGASWWVLSMWAAGPARVGREEIEQGAPSSVKRAWAKGPAWRRTGGGGSGQSVGGGHEGGVEIDRDDVGGGS